MRTTAMSPTGNVPSTFAGCEVPSGSVTDTLVAPSTTWLFVITSPLVSNTSPEPSPRLVWICTTAGETSETTCSYVCCSAKPAFCEGACCVVVAGVLLPPLDPEPPAPCEQDTRPGSAAHTITSTAGRRFTAAALAPAATSIRGSHSSARIIPR